MNVGNFKPPERHLFLQRGKSVEEGERIYWAIERATIQKI